MDYFLIYLTLAAYYVAAALWLAFFLVQRQNYCRLGAAFMTAGFAGHTVALLWRTLRLGMLPAVALGETLLVFAWALAAAFLFLYWRFPIKVLGALVAPVAALLVSASLILPAGQGAVSPMLQSLSLACHVILAILGNAALTMAGLGGVFYLLQEREIKGKRFGFFYRRLPSLDQLDALNYWCLTLGFPLLTAGIISGSLYAQSHLGTFWRWDVKEVLTLTAWLIYAVLLHERLAVGWRGRRAAWLAISGLAALVITFVGANLWLESYHSFASFMKQP